MSKRAAPQELDYDPILARKFSHFKITSLHGIPALQHFALSILGNQKLVQYVRKMTLNYDYWAYIPSPAEAFSWTLTAEAELKTQAIFKAVIAEQKWEKVDATELLRHLMMPSSPSFADALIAVFLPILTNVEKCISEIRVLALLEGRQREGIEDGGTYYDISSGASDVEEIHLKDCELSGWCLTNIIGFSNALRKFTYCFGGRASPDGSTAALYSPQLAKALTPHRLTLQSLNIDVESLLDASLDQEIQRWEYELREAEAYELTLGEKDPSRQSDVERWNSATRSDPYFPNLKYLCINIALRFPKLSGKKILIEWLPAGLEELEFVGYSPEEAEFITDQMTEVVQRREELLPKLKVLKGIEEYIECERIFDSEEDDIPSDGTIEDSD